MNTVGLLGDKCVILVNQPLTKKEAIKLAADIVFLCDGNLVLSQTAEEGVTSWNLNSPFFKAYAAIVA